MKKLILAFTALTIFFLSFTAFSTTKEVTSNNRKALPDCKVYFSGDKEVLGPHKFRCHTNAEADCYCYNGEGSFNVVPISGGYKVTYTEGSSQVIDTVFIN